MKVEDYYDNLEYYDNEYYYDNGELIEVMQDVMHKFIELHERVKQQLTLDDLVSVVVCQLLHIDNHPRVEAKINSVKV